MTPFYYNYYFNNLKLKEFNLGFQGEWFGCKKYKFYRLQDEIRIVLPDDDELEKIY